MCIFSGRRETVYTRASLWWYFELQANFMSEEKKKPYVDRADELTRKIKHVHSGKSNAVNKPIYAQKVCTVNVGIKCME